MEGWVMLHRKLIEWEWYKEPNTLVLFVHCLLKANHKDGKWKGAPVKRGQLITGRKQLSTETGLTERQIRTALNHLKSTNELTIKTTSKYSLVTLVKYSDYQGGDQQSDQQNASKATSEKSIKRPSSDQQTTTNNNVNNNKNVNKDNNKSEKPVKISSLEKHDFAKWPSKPSLDIFDDWLAMRKSKKASTSKTVMNTIGNELQKAVIDGFSVDHCLAECITRNWQGFKADWLKQKTFGQQPARKIPNLIPTTDA